MSALRSLGIWVFVGIAVLFPGAILAETPIEQGLLPKDAAVRIQIERPLAWRDHPWLQELYSIIYESPQIRDGLKTPEFARVQVARDFLESATGQSWETALDRITAGGILAAFSPTEKGDSLLIISAQDARIWKQLQSALAVAIKAQGQPLPKAQDYKKQTIYRIEKAFLAVVEHRLIVSTSKKQLEESIEVLQRSETKTQNAKSPRVQVRVNLEAVRQLPDFRKALKKPAEDAGLIAIFGGYVDLLASADELVIDLNRSEDSDQIHLSLAAKNTDRDEVLAGFFAKDDTQSPAVPLSPPGTIYSASWFRDYSVLWSQRGELLADDALQKLEKGDADIKQQFSIFGVSFSPSTFAQQLGTSFRVVVTQAGKNQYRIEPPNRLPAAALCVSLRDESVFQEQLDAVGRAASLVATFGEAKMLSKTADYSRAKLKGLWFRDDEKSAGKGNKLRFNLNPTWAVARGHFILGSTRNIVERVIDSLDQQATGPTEQTPPGITETQRFALAAFSEAVEQVRSTALQTSIMERGLSRSEATGEFDLFRRALGTLREVTTHSGFTDTGFQYHLTIHPRAASHSSKR